MEHTRRPVGEHGGGLAGDEDALDLLGSYAAAESTISVHEASFPARVAAFLRFSPVIEAAQAARRQEWPDGIYDIVTLALTAIDLVVSRQGFESEATRSDVVAALTDLAAQAGPERPADEHRDIAAFVVDSLLNRSGRQAPFRYVTSDYSSPETGHRRREVPFSLLIEHDHPARNENVLRATNDAINALIGGLDFDVEDEQVATELVLERQLARHAFDAALKSAERARLLSVGLAEQLDRLIADVAVRGAVAFMIRQLACAGEAQVDQPVVPGGHGSPHVASGLPGADGGAQGG